MPRLFRSVRRVLALALVLSGLMLAAPPRATAATASCTANTPFDQRPVLRAGDRGSCVRVLQQLLESRGYAVRTTSSFDAATELAVRRFQHDHLDLAIDGLVAALTWRVLVVGGPAYVIQKGPNTSDRVLLSFDDCPPDRDSFEKAVTAAQELGIALALLPTGNCLTAGRFDATFARQHGHYVFNHSVTHARLTELSAKKVYAELGAPGVVTTYGRPPFGAYNTETVRNAYARRGMRIWTWTVDTRDWEAKTTDEVITSVVDQAGAGDTVLMHMGWNAFNGPALIAIQAGLDERGLTVCRNKGPTDVRPTLDC